MLGSGDVVTGVVAPFFNLFLFLYLLVRLTKKPLAAFSLSKKEAYHESLKEAAEALASSQSKLSQVKRRLQGLDEEVRKIRENAQREAQAERARIAADAKEAVERIKADGERVVRSEKLLAGERLREQMFALVRSQVGERLEQEFSEADHRRLVSLRVSQIDAQRAEGGVS